MSPPEPIENAMRLREAAEKVLRDFECDHRSAIHGDCGDCLNRGTIVTCQEEEDIVEGCLRVLRGLAAVSAPPGGDPAEVPGVALDDGLRDGGAGAERPGGPSRDARSYTTTVEAIRYQPGEGCNCAEVMQFDGWNSDGAGDWLDCADAICAGQPLDLGDVWLAPGDWLVKYPYDETSGYDDVTFRARFTEAPGTQPGGEP